MLTEECRICDATVPYDNTIHLLIHTKSDAGVVDYYICKPCYNDEIQPLFASDT